MELDKLLRTLLNEKSENSENKGTQQSLHCVRKRIIQWND